ncbi:WD40 repeat-like protein [Nadsonia fulvescens var. elongata DSM 6958]|uniref:WD40 repeat-like protein n=1 Tax=Nadsonia fulvescens var. elongata DSM 6958 TaxID=857566 RepID=A0A1E3PR78_9ASCO|nr:WD40 repeat-like protein [Nadsonia fulvescens var. elongata DSM 6958]
MDSNQGSPNDSYEDLSSSSSPLIGADDGFYGVELLRIIDGRSFTYDIVDGSVEQIFMINGDESRRVRVPLQSAQNSILRGREAGSITDAHYENGNSIDVIVAESDPIEPIISDDDGSQVHPVLGNSGSLSLLPSVSTVDTSEADENSGAENLLPFATGYDIEDDEDDEDFLLNVDEIEEDEEADRFLTDPASESESEQAPSIRLLTAFSDNHQLDSDYSSSSYVPSPDSQNEEHDILSLSSDSDSDYCERDADHLLASSTVSSRGDTFSDINSPVKVKFTMFADKEKILRVAIDSVSIKEKITGLDSEKRAKEFHLGPGERMTPQLLADISDNNDLSLLQSMHDPHSRFAVNLKQAVINKFFIRLFPRGKILDVDSFYGSKNDKNWQQSRFFGISFLRPNNQLKVKSSGILKEKVRAISKPCLRRHNVKRQRNIEKNYEFTDSLKDTIEGDTQLATTKETVYRFDIKNDNSLANPKEAKELVEAWNLEPARKNTMYYNRLDIPRVPKLAKPYIRLLTRDSFKNTSDSPLHRRLLDRELSPRPGFLQPKLTQGLIPSEIGRAHEFYDSRLYSGQFSKDGSLFINSSADFLVKIYDTSTSPEYPELKYTIKITHGRWALTDTQISPNNKLIATSSLTPAIQINTVPEDLQQKNYDNYDYENGRYYSGSYTNNKNQTPHSAHCSETSFIHLLDRPSRSASYASVFAIKFSRDSRRLVSAGSVNTIQDTDIEYDKPITKLWGHESDVNAVEWLDRSCQKLISGDDDGYIKVWDLRTGEKPLYLVGHTEGITSLEAHENETFILSNAKDQTLKLFDIRSAVSYSNIADETLDNYNTGFDYRGEIYPGTVKGRHPLDSSIMTYQGHSVLRTLIRAHFSPYQSTGSKYIYSGSADGGIYIWKLDGTPVRRLEVQKSFKYGSQLNEFYKNDGRVSPRSFQRVGQYSSTLSHFKSCLTRDAAWHPRLPIIISSSWVHNDAFNQFASFGSFNSENDGEDSEDDANIVFSGYSGGCMMVHEFNQRAPFVGHTYTKVQRKTKFSDIAPNSEFLYFNEPLDSNTSSGHGNNASISENGYFGF